MLFGCCLLALAFDRDAWSGGVWSGGKEGERHGDAPLTVESPEELMATEDCDAAAVDICVDLRAVEHSAALAQVRVELHATEDCYAVALLRVWDDACQCLRTSVHAWDGSATVRAPLRSGVTETIALEVSRGTPVDPEILVLTASSKAALPATSCDAEGLLDCLGDSGIPVLEFERAAKTCVAAPICMNGETLSLQ